MSAEVGQTIETTIAAEPVKGTINDIILLFVICAAHLAITELIGYM